MKRSLSLLLAIIMILSALPLTGFSDIIPIRANAAETEKSVKIYYGDMNENGKLEAADARLILRRSVSLEVFSERQEKIADCNADGKITAADARSALRASVGLESLNVFENNVLTNAEFLTMLMASVGYGAYETAPYFKNVPASHKDFEGVQAAVDWNVLDKKTAFEPDKEATVGYALELAAKIKDVPSGAKLLDGTVDKKAELTKEIAEKIIDKVNEYRLKDTEEKEFESVEVKDTVTEYEKADIKAVDKDTFTVKNDTPKAGEVFIAETSEGEVARKIVSAKKNADGTYTVETEKPAMDEVFDDFSFRASYSLDASEVQFVPAENVFVVNDPTKPQLHMSDKEENVILDKTYTLNSSNDPNLTPKLCVTTTSDYMKALNNEYVCQVPNGKELLEKYNQLVAGPSADKKTLKTEKVIKYETGWGVEIGIKFSNFDIDFDFSDFWTKGDYEITLETDVHIDSEFKGKFNSYVKLGHFPVKLGIADIFMDLNVDIYLYFDANGDVKLVGDGKIEQTYGNYDGKTDYLNNNTFTATLEANIEAEGGLKVNSEVAVLGMDIAEMEIKLGVFGEAHAKATPLVEYKNELYYYAGDFMMSPAELKKIIGLCVDLGISYPIVTVTVSAGEDAKKQIEKLKKKNPDMKIPTTHTFNICTLDENTLLKPVTKKTHIENTDKGIVTVKECTRTDYEFIAHKLSGYVVDKNTGKSLASATVQLLDSKGTVISTATTDASGNFELKFIPFGTYKLNFIKNETDIPAEKSFTINKNETNVGKVEVDTINEAAIYTKYLNNGGYNNFSVYSSNKKTLSGIAVESCLVDLTDDGIEELFIKIYYSKLPGTRGYWTNTALLTIDNNSNVKILLNKEFSGGTAGGDMLSLKFDAKNSRYVIACEARAWDGTWANVRITDIYSGENGFKAPVVSLKTEGFFTGTNYYSGEINQVKKETSWYYYDGDYFRYYQIDGKYVSQSSFDVLDTSFVTPSVSKYTMKTVTLKNPA